MKTILLIIFSVPYFICAQNTTGSKTIFTKSDSTDYLKRSMAFIRQVMQKEISDSNLMLIDNPFTSMYEGSLEKLLSDPNLFSQDEISMIKQRKYPAALKWKAEWFPHATILDSDTVKNVLADIFTRKSKGWPYFHQKFGKGYNSFSMPIFLRNNTVCVFYSDIHCGDRCAEGSLFMYKKENEVWIKIEFPGLTWIA